MTLDEAVEYIRNNGLFAKPTPPNYIFGWASSVNMNTVTVYEHSFAIETNFKGTWQAFWSWVPKGITISDFDSLEEATKATVASLRKYIYHE